MASDKLIPVKVVSELTGFAVKTIRMRAGQAATLPAPVRIGRAVRWSRKEVERWVSDKLRERRASGATNVIQMPPPSGPPTLTLSTVKAIVSAFRKPISPASTGEDECPTRDSAEDQERLAS